MSRVALSVPVSVWEDMVSALDLPVESAAVLGAGVASDPDGDLTLFGRGLTWVPEEAYSRRTREEMIIPSKGWVPGLGRAAVEGPVAVFVHTHPGARPAHSAMDRVVDDALARPFTIRTGQPVYGHLVLGGTSDAPEIDGLVLDADGFWRRLEVVRVIGRRTRLFVARDDGDPAEVGSAFDRQVRMFGVDGQKVLAALHVGVAGAGGTGSAVIEQVARLGVGRITAVDPDTLTEGNVTRVYGSTLADVDRPKVEVVGDHVARICLGTGFGAIQASVNDLKGARALRHCDVVFGCTDDNAGRMVLSRLGYWYLLPVIDMGAVIRAEDGEVRGVFGRVTMVGPGSACLLCGGHIDLARAQSEVLEPNERARLAAEGYADGLGDPDPSVVPFTTMVAATAVSALLESLFGYGQEDPPTNLIMRIHRQHIVRSSAAVDERCYCGDPGVLGSGDVEPMLDVTWP